MAIQIRRREFMFTLGGAAAAWPITARAQQSTMPVIGFLHPASPDPLRRQVAAFWRALNEGGYVEGQNLAIQISLGQGPLRPRTGAPGRPRSPASGGDRRCPGAPLGGEEQPAARPRKLFGSVRAH